MRKGDTFLEANHHKKGLTAWISLWAVMGACVIILVCAHIHLMDSSFYDRTAGKLGVSLPHAQEYNEEIMMYLLGIRQSIDGVPFSQKELDHMRDVRDIIKRAYTLLHLLVSGIIISMILVLLRFEEENRRIYEHLAHTARAAGLVTLMGIMVLGTAGMLPFFDVIFGAFHAVLFEHGTWVFESADIIIQIYPYEFFRASLIAICMKVIILSAIIAIVSHLYVKWAHRK